MELEHWPYTLRIVLVGETGAGKSSTGNTICRRRAFTTKSSDRAINFGCVKEIIHCDGQRLSIVDTPGFFDPNKSDEEVKREIAKGVALAAPGPHVLLLVLRPGEITYKERKSSKIIWTLLRKLAAHFTTNKERETVKIIEEIFGKRAPRHTMALFTHGDELEHGKTIEEFIDHSPDLCALVRQCGGGYHVLNNRERDLFQVRELLEKINTMAERNARTKYLTERVSVEQEYLEGFIIGFGVGFSFTAVSEGVLTAGPASFGAAAGAAAAVVGVLVGARGNARGAVVVCAGAGIAAAAAIAAFGTFEGVVTGASIVAGLAVGVAAAGADVRIAAFFAGGAAAGVAVVQATIAGGVALGNAASAMLGVPVASVVGFILYVALKKWR